MVQIPEFFNKKGVSPLIATVLLISFAVALGSVVLNWGKNLDVSPGNDCSSVSLQLRELGTYQACYGGLGKDTYINFMLDNKGSVDVEGIGIWIFGTEGTKLLDLDDFILGQGQLIGIKDDTIKYDAENYGKIKNIQFIPKIKTEEGIDICPSNSVKAEIIGACNT